VSVDLNGCVFYGFGCRPGVLGLMQKEDLVGGA
jgi:hypothetical protein